MYAQCLEKALKYFKHSSQAPPVESQPQLHDTIVASVLTWKYSEVSGPIFVLPLLTGGTEL